MLNPIATFRLGADELALIMRDAGHPACKAQDCRYPPERTSEIFEEAIRGLEKIFVASDHEWPNINAKIAQGKSVVEFLVSRDRKRVIERDSLVDSR